MAIAALLSTPAAAALLSNPPAAMVGLLAYGFYAASRANIERCAAENVMAIIQTASKAGAKPKRLSMRVTSEETHIEIEFD
ncbi:hypothetical protein HBA55_26060 [Pseudomaricurvus alkylphenolicus]|uniref:hypothetical protein n=1 Tax=Pseudomaricurvus alkylphenolicus TaxID=1306991 RepID=UPI00142307CC|nr:hypothetical protein [Pseudomaricurvus alkylphenolicus]NIB43101.1 hypothetical protein [Pseudomaricurvus alkylphenolicus]